MELLRTEETLKTIKRDARTTPSRGYNKLSIPPTKKKKKQTFLFLPLLFTFSAGSKNEGSVSIQISRLRSRIFALHMSRKLSLLLNRIFDTECNYLR